jgi:transposase-like protein
MPADFVERYEQSSTIGALAESYGVPRHTAQAWINTARRHGQIKPAKQYASRG